MKECILVLKVTLLHECSSRFFFKFSNGTKSRKAFQILPLLTQNNFHINSWLFFRALIPPRRKAAFKLFKLLTTKVSITPNSVNQLAQKSIDQFLYTGNIIFFPTRTLKKSSKIIRQFIRILSRSTCSSFNLVKKTNHCHKFGNISRLCWVA